MSPIEVDTSIFIQLILLLSWSWVCKAKIANLRPHRRKGRKQLFSTCCQQAMFCHVLGSKASIHVVVAQEDRCFHNKSCPLHHSSPLLSFYCWACCHMVWKNSLVCLGHWGVCEDSLAVNAILATSAEHHTIWAAVGTVNSIPAKPSRLFPWILILSPFYSFFPVFPFL